MRFLWKMILKEIWQRLSNLNSEIRRGDLYYADLSPVVGSEQGGVRPVLVIQNNIGNKYLTPNKKIKVLVKNHKIYFISQI